MNQDANKDLQHIRQMMEQSSRFISLSGLSGVVAGIVALIAGGIAFYLFQQNDVNHFDAYRNNFSVSLTTKLIALAIVTLIVALTAGIAFTVKRSKQKGLPIWTNATKQLLINLGTPLLVGGIFCMALIYHSGYYLVAPTTLVFYGLGLINASKYTYTDINYLGYCEVLLGLIALFLVGYGLVFWTLGFGVLHILYGFLMHKKYK